MILIAHRGNVAGIDRKKENNPIYLDKALSLGYDIEIDIWEKEGKLFLGHDQPDYEIDEKWILERKNESWIHCKNIQAVHFMLHLSENLESCLNYFWHQEDDYTLTSRGFIWAYPGKHLYDGSHTVCVMPERANYDKREINSCYGICSDYVEDYR